MDSFSPKSSVLVKCRIVNFYFREQKTNSTKEDRLLIKALFTLIMDQKR